DLPSKEVALVHVVGEPALQRGLVGTEPGGRHQPHGQMAREATSGVGVVGQFVLEETMQSGSGDGVDVRGGCGGVHDPEPTTSRSLEVKRKIGNDRAMSPEPLTIGQVSERTGLATSAIRFYEEKGLISSGRSPGGQRLFERPTIRR